VISCIFLVENYPLQVFELQYAAYFVSNKDSTIICNASSIVAQHS